MGLMVFLLSTEAIGIPAPSAGIDAVEKELRDYLRGRVLVFREPVPVGLRPRFDSRGVLLETPECSGETLEAILFLNLRVEPERLVVTGEAIDVVREGGERTYRRSRLRLDLVQCAILLDIPPQRLTFPRGVSLLARVFWSKEELDRAGLGRKTGFQPGFQPVDSAFPAWTAARGGLIRACSPRPCADGLGARLEAHPRAPLSVAVFCARHPESSILVAGRTARPGERRK